MSRTHSILGLAVLLLFASQATAEPYKLDAGPHAVTTLDQTWHDAKRNRDVPVRIYLPANLNAPQPVILLSHGLGGTRQAMNYAAEHWASWGYVCVALQHPGSDDSVWRDAPIGSRLARMREAASMQNAAARVEDVRFAVDHLIELAGTDEWKPRLDLKHIGIAGHSFGAQTVQATMGQRPAMFRRANVDRSDSRIAAGIAFSPAYHGIAGQEKTAFADVKRPMLHVTGTADASKLAADVPPDARRVPYDAIDADRQYLMTFTDGTHAVFGGIRPNAGESPLDKRIHDGVRQLSTAFWDATLRDDATARAWLDGEAAQEALQPLGTYEHKQAAPPAP